MAELEFNLLSRYTIAHAVRDETLLCSRKNRLFELSLSSKQDQNVGHIPWPPMAWPCNIRLLDRILKHSIAHVQTISDVYYMVVTGKGEWWLISNDQATAINTPSKTCPLMRGSCVNAAGTVFYGEYFDNAERRAVAILASDPPYTDFRVIYTFQPGEIRHIHGLLPDPFIHGRIWITCGDENAESTIYFTEDDFATVERFCNYGQRTRAVDLIIRKDEIVWAMDSPLQRPYIVRVNKTSPKEPEMLYELNGPAYYISHNEAGGIYISTTPEPGPAVKDNKAYLVALRPDGSWEEVYHAQSDWVPQFGLFYLPQGTLPGNTIVLSSRAVTKKEGHLLVAEDTAWT